MQGAVSSLLFFFTGICSLYGQTASLRGQVLDSTGTGIEHVVIQIKGTAYTAKSEANGQFKILSIKPGKYQLVCTGLTIEPVQVNLDIRAGADSSLKIMAKHAVSTIMEVVVSATRTEKDLTDLPLPVKVISGEQIRQMGSMRLNEVLQEQTGLVVTSDEHGTGIQMQGFNPDYTMILLDGEPMIGRTAGTFDLTRLAVGNIKRIEIIKGPSSSLYGSEALAGIINIITEKPTDTPTGQIRTRYGSNNTLDLNASGSYKWKKLGLYVFGNRYSTSGYDLDPNVEGATVPPYQNYTGQSKLTYKLNPKTDLSISARIFTENSQTQYGVVAGNQTLNIDQKGSQYDWNLFPSIVHRFNEKNRLSMRFYSTKFHTYSLMTNKSSGSTYDESYFDQSFTRPEVQYDHTWLPNHQTTMGMGSNVESVMATRYTQLQQFNNVYGYLQHDFTLFHRFSAIVGARIDHHSVYGTQISPKISAKYRITDKISIRASVGRGFKAPDFRQLYLNWSNPVDGYNVFGSQEVKYQLANLEQQGQISQVLIDPNGMQPIRAEYSTAYNIGFVAEPIKNLTWQANFFRNDIYDMIETAAIAIKTNGQSVYSYFNLSQVYTQGFETDLSAKPIPGLTISAGYQYLEAYDKQVLKDIKAGKYYTNVGQDPVTLAPITKQVNTSDYGGLFNRSKHMANARIFYSHQKTGWGGSFRAVYRGRYGFGDLNGNLILDDDKEYINGYFLFNIAISKKFFQMATVQFGIDNLTNFKMPMYIPSLPGRIYYTSLSIDLKGDKIHNRKKEL